MNTEQRLTDLLDSIPAYMVPNDEWAQALGQTPHMDAQRLIDLERSGMRWLTVLVGVLMAGLAFALVYRPPFMGAWAVGMLVAACVGSFWLVRAQKNIKEHMVVQSMIEREQLLLVHGWTMALPMWEHLEEMMLGFENSATIDARIQELEEHGWSKPPLAQAFWEQLSDLIGVPSVEELDMMAMADQEVDGVDAISESDQDGPNGQEGSR